ncbi:MAG TPA: hypothetical protein PKK99_10565, partial [Bacteroidia bacterium]|nr:hypothetical protein [Bacteroidia bacterium]
ISARNLLLPLIVFLMPIIDTTTVVINRLMKGQSPFVGGKDHTTHALAYLGLSDRQLAMVFWFMTLLSLLLVVIIEKYLKNWTHTYTIIFSVYILLMFSLFYYAAQSVKRRKEKV